MPASRSAASSSSIGDRLVGDVAAGHHERRAGVGQQQVVQRRVRQHHARARRSAARPTAATRAAGRRRRARSAGPASRAAPPRAAAERRPALAPRAGRGAISANGLSSRCLRARRRGHRRLVVGAAGQVEAADALHRDDRAAEQRLRRARRPGRRVQRRPSSRTRGPQSGQALGWAWKRRSPGSLVLRAAGRAHLEAGHRRVRPVVGDVAHDREARPAVGAVDERVAEAPVARVEQLGQAVGAGRAVGRDRGPRLAARAGSRGSRSRARPAPRRCSADDPLDRGQRRRLERQPGEEALDGLGRRLDLDHHAARVVEHVAGHAQLAGQPVDVGPEADALDRPLDAGADPAHARPAPAAGGRRSPAPPGCAGCAPSGSRRRGRRARSRGDPPAVVAHQRDRAQAAPARLGQRGDHVRGVAARGDREQRVARRARGRSPGGRRSPRSRCRSRSRSGSPRPR